MASVLFWILLGLAVGQVPLVWAFVRALRRGRKPELRQAPYPKVAAVLCLRGTDPFLGSCVEALLNQDYPDYDVRIVVDSRQDPAWEVVEEVVHRCKADNVRIIPLENHRETCSLKCSSLLQAVATLDESHEVVAQLDADTVPHPTWLKELVAPLADDRVGVATGNRWYMPETPSPGALVRYAWNAAAVVQMFCYRIPWGGTLAIKTSVFRDSDLKERWGKAFCEDTMLFEVLRKQGLKVAFVPSLMMVNREACDVPGYSSWVRRQLLTARLYHPRWLAVAGHGLMTSLVQAAAVVLLVAALVTGRGEVAAWVGGGLAVYLVSMVAMLLREGAAVDVASNKRSLKISTVCTVPLVTASPRRFSENVYEVAMSLAEKHRGHPG
jgi:cellulose synthase/poly-beta-1,6-N-acetylglucosamine synthase-like glycosyltransferase